MRVRIALSLFTLLMAGIIVGAAPDQPFMRAARADLQSAKSELQRASPDKGGHRVKAIALVNKAIAQVNAGIAFDHRHNHATLGVKVTPDHRACKRRWPPSKARRIISSAPALTKADIARMRWAW